MASPHVSHIAMKERMPNLDSQLKNTMAQHIRKTETFCLSAELYVSQCE